MRKTKSSFSSMGGFTLIELLITLAISFVAVIVIAKFQKLNIEKIRAVDAGTKFEIIGRAATNYLNENIISFNALPGSSVVSTTVPISKLKEATSCQTKPCLTTDFKEETFWGAAYTVKILRFGNAAPFQYHLTVATTAGSGPAAYTVDGVTRLDLAAHAAKIIGGNVGFTVTYDVLPRAISFGGTWAINKVLPIGVDIQSKASNPIGGQFFYYHFLVEDPNDQYYLKRDGTNSMSANLNIGGKGVYDLGYGVNNSSISSANDTSTENTITAGGLRVNGSSNLNGGTNVSSGNLVVANDVIIGNTTVSGAMTVGGNAALNSSLSVAGNMQSNGNIIGSSNLTLTSNSGDIKMAGLLATKTTDSIKSLTANLIEVSSVLVGDGSSISSPICPTGGLPRIFVIPSVATVAVYYGNAGYIFSAIGPVSGPWTINAKDSEGNSLPGANIAHARTFCSF